MLEIESFISCSAICHRIEDGRFHKYQLIDDYLREMVLCEEAASAMWQLQSRKLPSCVSMEASNAEGGQGHLRGNASPDSEVPGSLPSRRRW